MATPYKGFTLNQPSDAPPWGATEFQAWQDIIDTVLEDAVVETISVAGHHHYRVYAVTNDTVALTFDASNVGTFTAFPLTPSSAPTTDYQAANKKYVDDTIASEALWQQTGSNLYPATLTDIVGMGTEDPLLNVGGADGDFTGHGLHIKSDVASEEVCFLVLEGDSSSDDGITNYATTTIFADTDGGADLKMVGFRTFNNQLEILLFDDDTTAGDRYIRCHPNVLNINPDQSADMNFQVSGQAQTHAIFVDNTAANGHDGDPVGIHNSAPLAALDVIGNTRFGDSTSAYLTTDGSGNSWWVGEDAGLLYGGCYGDHIGWTQAAAVQNTWYNIVDADFASGLLNGVTHDGNGKLTLPTLGRYFISYSITVQADAANVHMDAGIEVNGSGSAHVAGQSHIETKFANQEEAMSGAGVVGVDATETIEIAIKTPDAGAPDLSVQVININVIQIGGHNPA